MILYLHGFASTGEGGKWEAMRDAFPGREVVSPTQPVDPFETMELVRGLFAERAGPHLAVGTSLGGFYAYCAAAMFGAAAFVINPSMRPWVSLRAEIGTVQRFDTDETFAWTREHVRNLERLAQRAGRAPGELVHFHLAGDDELLDHSAIPERYAEAATIRWYDNAGHRFERFPDLLPELERVLAGLERGR